MYAMVQRGILFLAVIISSVALLITCLYYRQVKSRFNYFHTSGFKVVNHYEHFFALVLLFMAIAELPSIFINMRKGFLIVVAEKLTGYMS